MDTPVRRAAVLDGGGGEWSHLDRVLRACRNRSCANDYITNRLSSSFPSVGRARHLDLLTMRKDHFHTSSSPSMASQSFEGIEGLCHWAAAKFGGGVV